MNKKITQLIKVATLTAAAILVTNAAQAQDFKLRWGHYLPNSAFVQVEKDFAKKNRRTDKR
jgi:ABC-type sugar transport system substrate-binding protein